MVSDKLVTLILMYCIYYQETNEQELETVSCECLFMVMVKVGKPRRLKTVG